MDRPIQIETGEALAILRELPRGFARLTFTSPPFEDRRRYGRLRFNLKAQTWVDWLRPIVVEMARVTEGLVILDLASPVRQFQYTASAEWLIADLTRLDGLVCGPAPYAWTKNGPFGSGGEHYQRRDWNPLYAVCRPEVLPLKWSDNTAFGKPPKFAPGGEAFNLGPGTRVNKWGGRSEHVQYQDATGIVLASRASHEFKPAAEHTEQTIANPGNVLAIPVGGHRPGHTWASESEAAMPPEVAERFIAWFCPPGELVLDPFCGCCSTGVAAMRLGRRFFGCDLRPEQVEVGRDRLHYVQPELKFTS